MSLTDCQDADIAFLLDGSGSVSREDFFKMKEFVKSLVRAFLGRSKKGKSLQVKSTVLPLSHKLL